MNIGTALSDFFERLPRTIKDMGSAIKQLRYLLTHGVDSILGGPTTDPLTGLDYIYNQLREILVMAACGACIAFLYEIYDMSLQKLMPAIRPKLPARLANNTVVVRTADILFCLVAGFIVLQFWYGSSYCTVSLHEGLALMAGIISGRRVFRFRNSKHMHTIALVYVIMLVTAYIIIA